MSRRNVYVQLSSTLAAGCLEAGFTSALVCTDGGLLVAGEGDEPLAEHLAALTALFDDILTRARTDLRLEALDEVTLYDDRRCRIIVRPIPTDREPRFFLVVRALPGASWRRATARLVRALAPPLSTLGAPEHA